MKDNNPQPRWWQLYLVLPLAVGMYWGIQRLHASGFAISALQIAALVVLGVYLEVWQSTNKRALLQHPFAEGEGRRVYHAREAGGANAGETDWTDQPVVPARFYSDLSPFPEVISEEVK